METTNLLKVSILWFYYLKMLNNQLLNQPKPVIISGGRLFRMFVVLGPLSPLAFAKPKSMSFTANFFDSFAFVF